MSKVAVVGGGPAGMMAAIAASMKNEVVLFEKNEKLGKKLYITGKGRCNLTNSAPRDEFLKSVIRNPKFFMSAYSKLDNTKLMDFFETRNLRLKEERGKRIFPESDKSSDIIKLLERELKNSGVEVVLNSNIDSIKSNSNIYYINNKQFDKVIIATGGLSYPQTGSTGDGYKIAASFGHTVIDLKPSLVPIETDDRFHSDLQGLTLKNIRLSANLGKKEVFNEIGELLFTHFGISGPLALSLSSVIDESIFNEYNIYVDLKPGLTGEKLIARIDRDIAELGSRQVKNIMPRLVPSALAESVLYYSGIDSGKKASQLSRDERNRIAESLKSYKIRAVNLRPIEEAVITRGGVNTKEINPSTMESKINEGLYFAGEVVDIDAQTGGFNLQIAFSTGYLAGISC